MCFFGPMVLVYFILENVELVLPRENNASYVGSAVLFVTLTGQVTSRMKPIGQVFHLALRE